MCQSRGASTEHQLQASDGGLYVIEEWYCSDLSFEYVCIYVFGLLDPNIFLHISF